jgi:hypothetical protein
MSGVVYKRHWQLGRAVLHHQVDATCQYGAMKHIGVKGTFLVLFYSSRRLLKVINQSWMEYDMPYVI